MAKKSKKKKFNWNGYNKSQTKEKPLFLEVLKQICDSLPYKYQSGSRKSLKIRNVVFCLCMRAYCMKSGRRLQGELELCKEAGLIDMVPHFNTMFNYLKNPNMTLVLQQLVKLTSLPLTSVEKKFACDSTGFGNSILDEKWSKIRQNYQKHHRYFKAHITYGVLTNIITSCRVTEATVVDSKMLPEMLDETSENFEIEEFSADKAYSTKKILQKIWDKGALPLIPFKSNASPKAKGCPIWKEMYDFFSNNNELFLKKYHLRSNAESGMRMIKARFGDLTQMRNPTGAKNDILAKAIAHNICVLIQEMFLLGIEFDFSQFRDDESQYRI